MEAEIRTLNESDAGQVRTIASLSWHWAYAGIFSVDFIDKWIDRSYLVESIREDIRRMHEKGDILFHGIFTNGAMAGFAEYRTSGSAAELLRLYLLPAYTRMGLGTRLMATAEDALKSRGVRECTLNVHESNNRAISFYMSRGFSESGRDGSDIVMRKRL